MTDLSSDIGLLRREVRDVRGIVANLDHRSRKQETFAIHRPAGLSARFAACALIARATHSNAESVARQHFGSDRDLAQLIEIRTAVAPAQTTVATWAAELAAVVTQDVAANLLPATVLAQLRQLSGQPYAFINGAVAKIPVHTPTPSGGFVGEGLPINVAALILAAISLRPKKAAAITALTRELANGSPGNVELALQTLLAQDLGLAIDNVLLSNAAATSAAPAGLLAGVTPVTASAATPATAAMVADIKALVAAISPALLPVLIAGTLQGTSIALLAPNAGLNVVIAPTLAAGTVIAVDAFAFASAIGQPDFSTDENPAIHMSDAALPIVGGTAQPPVIGSVAAPTTSLWQTACIGLRTLLEADWTLRRANAVSYVTGVSW